MSRELLERAAKAAGIEGAYFESDNPIHRGIYQARGEYYWNPLISDSEVFRLSVKLHLYVKHFPFLEDDETEYPGFLEVWRTDDHDPLLVKYLASEGERLSVTRRAITRAAAAIGGQQ